MFGKRGGGERQEWKATLLGVWPEQFEVPSRYPSGDEKWGTAGFGAPKRGQGQGGKTGRPCTALRKVKRKDEVTYRETVSEEERRELHPEQAPTCKGQVEGE